MQSPFLPTPQLLQMVLMYHAWQFWLLVCSWLVFLVERAATLVRCSSADTSCRKAAVKYFTRWALCMHAPVRMGIVVCGVTSHLTQVCCLVHRLSGLSSVYMNNEQMYVL